jgi:predicted nucleotidyltransferase
MPVILGDSILGSAIHFATLGLAPSSHESLEALPQIVKKNIADSPEKTVLIPNANYLLFQKCKTFLGRRHVKTRDAFDIHFLLSRGAQLDKTLRLYFEDLMAMKERDKESIQARIAAVTAKLCTVELRQVLPLSLFEQLEKEGFEAIRQSLRTVFSDWLAERRR